MKWTLVLFSAFLLTSAFAKEPQKRTPASKAHPCEADAKAKADKLLRLHHMDDSNAQNIPNFYIDDKVSKVAPLKRPGIKKPFDVLEVYGGIYKAEYRMRFIYAQIPDTCALMGQELLELSDPY